MDRPRVSVLMPTFQSEKYLKEALDSILCQTFGDFELLIIDDNSTDGTRSIVNSYADPRIRLINGPCNGLADALNTGIDQAQGEYIARMDSDDYSYPTRFEKQVKFLDDNTDIVLCGTWQEYFGNDSFIHRTGTSPEQCKINLLFGCDVCHSTVMFRKSFFIKQNLYYDRNYCAEDYELWNRVVEYGKITNIPEVLGRYRIGNENITHLKKDQLKKEQAEIAASVLKKHLGFNVSDDDKKYLYGWVKQSDIFDEHSSLSVGERYRGAELFLREIYVKNSNAGYYDNDSLLKAIEAKWYFLRFGSPYLIPESNQEIDQIFIKSNYIHSIRLRYINYSMNAPTLKDKIKKLLILIKK